MKKELVKYFDFAEGKDLKCHDELPMFNDIDVKESPFDNVIKRIYAPDPVTKLPSSDVGVFLSADTPPDIRDFIQRNLMGEVTPVNFNVEGVDDDTIAELTRSSNESIAQYAARVNDYMQRHYNDVLREQELRKHKNDSKTD